MRPDPRVSTDNNRRSTGESSRAEQSRERAHHTTLTVSRSRASGTERERESEHTKAVANFSV